VDQTGEKKTKGEEEETKKTMVVMGRKSPSLPVMGSPSSSAREPRSSPLKSAGSSDEAAKGKQEGATKLPPPASDRGSLTGGSGSGEPWGNAEWDKGPQPGVSGVPKIVSDEKVSIVAMDTEGVTVKKRTRSESGGDSDDSSLSSLNSKRPLTRAASKKKPALGPNKPGPKSRKGSI
jgi:hypothetical protein